MVLFSLQLLLVLAACFGLFRLWRAALPGQRWLQWVVAAGFLARAVGGQLLFWISWARLPIARGLQLGDGMWFFAIDGTYYYSAALAAANQGVGAILALDRSAQSVMFTQTLASAMMLFGSASSVALLLNLAFYLGMIAIVVRWAGDEPQARTAAVVAIVGISVSPSALLWSLQPLKDTFFQFLFVAFVAACAAWQRAWKTSAGGALRLAAGSVMVLILPALAAIRWYFGFALLIATTVFLFFLAIRSRGRMAASLAAATVAVFLLSRGLVAGAGPYLPAAVAGVLTPNRVSAAARELPRTLAGGVEEARNSFDRTGGSTSIKPGGSHETSTRTSLAPATSIAAALVSSAPEPAVPTIPPAAAQPAVPPARKPALQPAVPPAVQSTVQPVVSRPVQAVAPPNTASRIARLLSGIAAITIPSSIGESLGMFHIGGGRGMLWFTEVDTIVFDVVLFFAAYVLIRNSSASSRNPLVWLVLLTTLLVGLPLVYSVTNFGTLFRLREMIFGGLLLMPLAVMTGAVRGKASAS
ncbi:MAG: hypothetical protein QOC81_1391 [Thermoanaerobaculia bacterium]|nr:hypothetical protein [Thermoanaerobaculia bacterium]